MLGLLIGNEKYNTTNANNAVAFCITLMIKQYFQLLFPITPSLFGFMFNRLKQLDDQEYTTQSSYHCVEFWCSYIMEAAMNRGGDQPYDFFNSFVPQLCPLLIKKCRMNTKILSQNQQKEKENENDDQQQEKKLVSDVSRKDNDETKNNDKKSITSSEDYKCSDLQVNLIIKTMLNDAVSGKDRFDKAQRVRRACSDAIQHIAAETLFRGKTSLCFTKYCIKMIEEYSNSSDILNREAANLVFGALLNGTFGYVPADMVSIMEFVYEFLNKTYQYFDNNHVNNESLLLQRVSLRMMPRAIKLIAGSVQNKLDGEKIACAYNHVYKIWSLCIESFKLNRHNLKDNNNTVLLRPVNTLICELCESTSMIESKKILARSHIIEYITQILDTLASKFGIFAALETNQAKELSICIGSTMEVFVTLCKLLTGECMRLKDGKLYSQQEFQYKAKPILHEYENSETLVSNHLALTRKFLACVDLTTDTQTWEQCGDSLVSSIDLIRCCPDRNLSSKIKKDIQQKIFRMIISGSMSAVTTMFSILDDFTTVNGKNNTDYSRKSIATNVGICSNMLVVDITILSHLCKRCPKEFEAFFTGDSTSTRASVMTMLEMLSKCLSIDKLNDLLLNLNEKNNNHDDTASKAVHCVNTTVQNVLAMVGHMLRNHTCLAIPQVKLHFFDSLLGNVIRFLNYGDNFVIQSNANWVVGMAVDWYPNDMKPHRDVR